MGKRENSANAKRQRRKIEQTIGLREIMVVKRGKRQAANVEKSNIAIDVSTAKRKKPHRRRPTRMVRE